VGYLFPDFKGAASISLQVGEKTGSWAAIGTSTQPPATVNLFAASIQHNGTSPISYTIFPGTSRQTFKQKVGQLKLQEIQNDNTIAAIYDGASQIAMFIFWVINGGSATFTPSRGCAPITIVATGNIALIYRLNTGEVTVSDPSQSLITVQVSLALGVGQKPPHWGTGVLKTMVFQLPTGGLAGSSITQTID
jgi:hypothetical protein